MGQDKNQGEGNVDADRRYREQTREFVESGKIDEAAEKARNMTPEEKAESEAAVEKGKSKAKS